MEGGGWAAVQTWVRAAEAGTNDLQVVSAEDARPGDIVAYDWGGQEDFAADGHIGFLASNVEGGKFTALEGNYQDAVLSVPRQVGDANVKFLRIGGDAPPAGGAAARGPRPPPPLAAGRRGRRRCRRARRPGPPRRRPPVDPDAAADAKARAAADAAEAAKRRQRAVPRRQGARGRGGPRGQEVPRRRSSS